MKKILFILFAIFCVQSVALAAPGDTTWVQANNQNLTGYGLYDTGVAFPTGTTTYRKVLMIFTLGKYACPGYNPADPGETSAGHTGWCGDWDYTVQNIVMTPTDTFELGRFITPYANSLAPRTPLTWKQHYVYDVTAYASKLQGAARMRTFFSGYSGGFTGDIKFAFIEGTPERTVKGVKRLWNGSFNYGTSTDINTHFPAVTGTVPDGTAMTNLKFTVTGHGFDNNSGCSEFCSKNYDVVVNGTNVATRTIWRDNCGSNELYPQSGTWLYDRGNWCPGAIVYAHDNILPGLTAGGTFNTNIAFEAYATGGGSTPSYTTEAHLIHYGAMNHVLDASIESIINPTIDENHFRENTICGRPTIHVRNTGSTTITTMHLVYGLKDAYSLHMIWNGSLVAMAETDITLPEMPELNYGAGLSGMRTFTSSILTVNGVADEDTTNNTLTSQFLNASVFPLSFKVAMLTNNETNSSGNSETSWKIYDMDNNVVAQRTNASASTTYNDTVSLFTGCYRLELVDEGCNGLRWWANPTGTTSGTFFVKKLTGTNIALPGYPSSGTYAHDFGCGFTKYFYTSAWATGVNEITGTAAEIQVYPNPAHNTVNIDLTGISRVDGTIRIIDMLGREVVTEKCNQANIQINTTVLSNGVYTVQYIDNTNGNNKLQSRIIIAK